MDLNKKILLDLYPDYKYICGPYLRKDGRKQITLIGNNKRKTISYPKALVEAHLGRRLSNDETVDHKDRNKQNDDINNLAIIKRSEHSKLDAIYVKVDDMNCSTCGKLFKLSRSHHDTRSLSKAGPFCSKQCSGLYGAQVQNGAPKINRQKIYKEYYQLKKL